MPAPITSGNQPPSAILSRVEEKKARSTAAKKPEKPEDVPGPMHPLIRVHPVTGRKALYLGRRRIWPSQFIEGVSHEESEALLDKLWAHATQPRFTWRQEWRVGDVVVWDNRCTLHRRDAFDPAARRLLHRTQIRAAA